MKLLIKKEKLKLIKNGFEKTIIGFKTNIPIFFGILLLITIFQHYFKIGELIKNKGFFGVLFAGIFGSLSAGNPINSYIIANEAGNISTNGFMITVFLLTWITVGIIQLPAEAFYFGKKYGFIRNIIAFVSSFVAGYLIFLLYNLIG